MSLDDKLDDATINLRWLNAQVDYYHKELLALPEGDTEKFQELENKLKTLYSKVRFELRNIHKIMNDHGLDI